MRGGGTTGAAAGYSSFHDAAGQAWSLPAHAASSPAILVHNELQQGRTSSSTQTGGRNQNTSEHHDPQLPATPRAFPVVRDAVSAQENKTFFAKRTRSSLERAEFLAQERANRKKEAGEGFSSPFRFSRDNEDEEVPDACGTKTDQDDRFDSEKKDHPSSLLQKKPKCTLFANQRFIHPAKARTYPVQKYRTRVAIMHIQIVFLS